MSIILVTGSSGFIGSHLVRKLQKEGHFVVGADMEGEVYANADDFWGCDLRDYQDCEAIFAHYHYANRPIEVVYNLACLMGGMGFIGDERHAYDIMVGSTQIVVNIIEASKQFDVKKHFYSSSACVYNMSKQETEAAVLRESDAYPSMPDLIYGWQKLFSEQLYQAAAISQGFDVRIARFHNIFGEEGTWDGGKEKAPAALSRKVAQAKDGDSIEVWGTGQQTRSFMYVHECLEAVLRLMESDCKEPLNIGSDESVTINGLAQMIIDISGKQLSIKNIPGNVGVNGRNSDNTLIEQKLNWKPSRRLVDGLRPTYNWINQQVHGNV